MNEREVKDTIQNMSQHDKVRLLQCILCNRNPTTCGRTKANENMHGMCNGYNGKIKIEEDEE